ncbi:MAG: hypothetical protein CVU84_11510 [Firmicutes bacterium HGW-Firmicutes-1]|jgi:hypothetical protein|nr:MAG: hypothetical protein CVU84_11510 [Firmicutes bacterium HGW-Firmicutes-1]
MSEIMSEEVLIDELNHFRFVLTNYDFSEISNIVFFDMESLNYYLSTHEDNPIERQYQEIEIALNKLSPYLPSNISSDTIDVLSELLNTEYYNTTLLKEHLIFNIKLDFIERVKSIDSEEEWQKLLIICKRLRQEKCKEEFSVR